MQLWETFSYCPYIFPLESEENFSWGCQEVFTYESNGVRFIRQVSSHTSSAYLVHSPQALLCRVLRQLSYFHNTFVSKLRFLEIKYCYFKIFPQEGQLPDKYVTNLKYCFLMEMSELDIYICYSVALQRCCSMLSQHSTSWCCLCELWSLLGINHTSLWETKQRIIKSQGPKIMRLFQAVVFLQTLQWAEVLQRREV